MRTPLLLGIFCIGTITGTTSATEETAPSSTRSEALESESAKGDSHPTDTQPDTHKKPQSKRAKVAHLAHSAFQAGKMATGIMASSLLDLYQSPGPSRRVAR